MQRREFLSLSVGAAVVAVLPISGAVQATTTPGTSFLGHPGRRATSVVYDLDGNHMVTILLNWDQDVVFHGPFPRPFRRVETVDVETGQVWVMHEMSANTHLREGETLTLCAPFLSVSRL